eukprot:TRINITY_DN36566_c0_g1_i1.p1 TRINITY_DN36566_c0_g1~~TRINITY_DN36566_c0_g1_i1.p1  ORF type:complete len:254 (+),score=51.84 TRINITY_DN36566_c0_g1_i1:95-856(+)
MQRLPPVKRAVAAVNAPSPAASAESQEHRGGSAGKRSKNISETQPLPGFTKEEATEAKERAGSSGSGLSKRRSDGDDLIPLLCREVSRLMEDNRVKNAHLYTTWQAKLDTPGLKESKDTLLAYNQSTRGQKGRKYGDAKWHVWLTMLESLASWIVKLEKQEEADIQAANSLKDYMKDHTLPVHMKDEVLKLNVWLEKDEKYWLMTHLLVGPAKTLWTDTLEPLLVRHKYLDKCPNPIAPPGPGERRLRAVGRG